MSNLGEKKSSSLFDKNVPQYKGNISLILFTAGKYFLIFGGNLYLRYIIPQM
jgi:hypothetical protein